MRKQDALTLRWGDVVYCKSSGQAVRVACAEVRTTGGWVVIEGYQTEDGRYRTFWHTEVYQRPALRLLEDGEE